MLRQHSRKAETAAFLFIILLFLFTRLYHLSAVPRGIHVDEAGMAFDAYCLANYGTDRYGLEWPVYLINYGGGQSALYAYLAAAAIKLFHFSPTVFRLPAVLGDMLVLCFGMLIFKRVLGGDAPDGSRTISGARAALLGGFLITVCPYFIMASRWGLDCNLMLGFSVMSLYLLMAAADSGRLWLYGLAGLGFGITLYTYAIAFAVLPLFFLMAGAWLIWQRRLSLSQTVVFCAPVLILAAPLLLMVAFNSGILEPFSPPVISIPLLPEYRGGELSPAHLWENLNLFYILFSHDFLVYNGFTVYGTLYYLAVPFFLIGLCRVGADFFKTVTKKAVSSGKTVSPAASQVQDASPTASQAQTACQNEPLILAFFLAMTAAGLCMTGPNINRMNAIYFPLIYFTGKGIVTAGKYIHRLVPAAAAAGFLVCFCFFARYYYTVYPEEVYPQQYFNDSFIQILDRVDELFPGEEREIYVDPFDDNVVHPYIYTLLRRPDQWEQWLNERQWDDSYGHYHFNLPGEIDPEGVYIMYSDGISMAALENAGFRKEAFNDLWWIYWKE